MRPIFGMVLLAFACGGQTRSVIVLPAGSAVDPSHRNATILDVDTWLPLGNPAVGANAFDAFTLPNGSKTYVVSRSVAQSITVLDELGRGGRVLRSVDLPTGLTAAALTPDGKRLLAVSLSDPAMTILNTQNDQIMARIPLAFPGSSVVVNFDSTRAFVLSPENATVTAIDLLRNAPVATLVIRAAVTVNSQLTLGPSGYLYVAAGGMLHEIDAQTLTFTAARIAAPDVSRTPLFLRNGNQALMVNQGGAVALARLNPGTAGPAFGQREISRIRLISETAAMAYSAADKRFYRLELNAPGAASPAFTPLAGLPAVGDQFVAGFGGTAEDPAERWVFLSAGTTVYRIDPGTNQISASYELRRVAGLPILPPVPSRARLARLYGVREEQTVAPGATMRLTMRLLDSNGRPVEGVPVEVYSFRLGAISFSNSAGYAQVSLTDADLDWWGWTRLSFRVLADGQFFRPFEITLQDPARPDPPSRLRLESGNGQIVFGGREAPKPLQVKVLTRRFEPVAGVTVNWSVAGGGRLRSAQTVTDASGIAANTYTAPMLDQDEAPRAVTITATAQFDNPVRFTVIPVPAPGSNIGFFPGLSRVAPVGPSLGAGEVGQQLGIDGLRYRLVGPSGNPFPALELIEIELRALGAVSAVCEPRSRWPFYLGTGVIYCGVVLGDVVGTGNVRVYVGGQFVEELGLVVTPGGVDRVRAVSGQGQPGAEGSLLPLPLVGIAVDRTGKPVNGAVVHWQAAADQAVLLDTVSVSGPGAYPDPANPALMIKSDGIVSTRVRLLSDRPVWISVDRTHFRVGGPSQPVAVPWVPGPPVVSALSGLDGNGQSAATGSEFARPLLVQVSGQWVSGAAVAFTATGGLRLSSGRVNADVWGRAEVLATAGALPGNYTVTATAGGFSTTFALAVTRAGPWISSVVNGASRFPGLAPCGLAEVSGIALPAAALTVGGYPAAVRRANAESISFQVPCEAAPGPAALNLGSLAEAISIVPYAPGLFETAEKTVVAMKADGTTISAANPAAPGDEIRLWATGLGQASPAIRTGAPGSGERVNAEVVVGLESEGISAEAVYAPAAIGTYVVTFRIPASAATGANRPLGVAIRLPDGSFVHSPPSRIDIRP